MAQESSFDIVSRPDLQEVDNAVNQAVKELATRWDFRGSKSSFQFDKTKKEFTLLADDESKLEALTDILQSKLIKRGVSIKSLDYQKAEPSSGGTLRQVIKLVEGIPQEKAKKIVALIKDSKVKVQASIQGDQVRVTGKSRDDLQAVIALLRGAQDLGVDLNFTNYK
jgi:uncharacterized protein YajQ (UPF0234 family)